MTAWLRLALLCLLAGGGSAVIAARVRRAPVAPERELRTDEESPASGADIVVALLTSSQCAAARDTALPALVAKALADVRREARAAERPFTSVAIAMDADPKVGATALARWSGFREWATGGGLDGLAFRSMFRGANLGADATPSLVIGQWVPSATARDGSELVVLRRIVGLGEIKAWARDPSRHTLSAMGLQAPPSEPGG